ncbi:MAG: FtsX-like permease family protein, partial [Longimicrobiales bacterium]
CERSDPVRLDWYVARRYLASRRKGRFLSLITLISIGGIALGVTALITVIAVMTGLQRDLQSKILGSNPHVYVFEGGRLRLGEWRKVLPQVREIPGVISAAPFMMTNVLAVAPGNIDYAQPGILFGVDAMASDTPMTVIERQLRSGQLAFGPTAGLPGLLVGRRLAARLGVLPGDTLGIVGVENIRQTPTGLMPAIREFEVTGTFETGMYEYDERNMYAEIPAVQDLLGLPADTVTGIAVNITDPWNADRVAANLFDSLGPPYEIQNWMELNSSLFSALKLEKLAMAVILFLIVLVAAFNIISTLIMVVTDKTREIGILKSMGMTDRMVLRIFILQGLTIGLIGTALGSIGGWLLSTIIDRYDLIHLPGDVYFIETLPVTLDPFDFVMIVVTSLLISFVATIYPARQASRLLPVDAIRHD